MKLDTVEPADSEAKRQAQLDELLELFPRVREALEADPHTVIEVVDGQSQLCYQVGTLDLITHQLEFIADLKQREQE